MKYSKEQKEVLTTLFAHNPEVEVLYLTSDNQAFTQSHNADSHSQRMKDEKVLTVTRDAFEAGEAPLETERAQEAGEGKIKTVETIPSEVIDLEGGSKDAGTAAEIENDKTKASLTENADNTDSETEKVKAAAGAAITEQQQETPVEKTAEELEVERQVLLAEYEKLAGKKANYKTGIEKLKALIAEEKAKIA